MKRHLIEALSKNIKKVKAFVPNNIRLSFYILPMGEISYTNRVFNHELIYKPLLEDDGVNLDLFEMDSSIVEGDIFALLQEGVIPGVKTGADLGIYDYPPVDEKQSEIIDCSKFKGSSKPIDSEDTSISYFSSDNDCFVRNCVLAEENPLSGNGSKIVYTFTGYLEVTKKDSSFIRCCDSDKRDIAEVNIPKEFLYKYQLRHGDEILCTCKKDNDKMVIDSLFNINQISRRCWDTSRPWFNNLKSVTALPIKCVDEYLKSVSNKFGLNKGDNVFIYLTKSTQKKPVLTQLVKELNASFDKIIYINPNYKPKSLNIEGCNIAKFTTLFEDCFNIKVTNILLATQHAKRMVEMGKKVAILIDDIDAVDVLDKEYGCDSAIVKTIFGTSRVCECGDCTSFTLVSLRTNNLASINIPKIYKCAESLGVIVDNNEIDLYNSYRI